MQRAEERPCNAGKKKKQTRVTKRLDHLRVFLITETWAIRKTARRMCWRPKENVFSELLLVMRRSAEEAAEARTADRERGDPANS